nr:hypothetical protein [Actinomycetota bacterium]
MATRESKEGKEGNVLSQGAGLAAAISVESGPELGEHAQVKARGYWEAVWQRLRGDRVAIGSAVFIVVLVIAAFGGAPLAAKI